MTKLAFHEFREAVAKCWPDMSESCRTCQMPDCMGSISVQPSERGQMLSAGIKLMRVNGPAGPVFVDNYPRDGQGRAVVGLSKPKCPYRDAEGRCSVHGNKPLICSIYPLGMEMIGDSVYWAMYLDCEYIQKIIASGRFETLTKQLMAAALTNLTASQREELTQTFRDSYALAAWPDGSNRVSIIEEVI